MGKEIERKFKVKDDSYKILAKKELYRQGYLSNKPGCVVRVRVINDKGYLTVKSAKKGISRNEYEYEIPVTDALEMIDSLCKKPLIEKYRYKVPYKGFIWEIDEFIGENEGLVVAEIELQAEDQAFEKPDWIGGEVTSDYRYYNSNLMQYPYSKWNS